MSRKLLIAASVIVGAALFVVVLAFTGFDNIIEPFRKFSIFYLTLFLLATALLHIINTLRWSSVLKHQGFKVPFLLLLRYKLIGNAVSYLTPAARMGGEPVRGYLIKKKLGLKGKHAYSSILIEMSLGMSIDALLVAVILIAMLLFFTLPNGIAGFALALSLLVIVGLAVFYSTLINRLGPFSLAFRILSLLVKRNFLKELVKRIISIEDVMVEFLHLRKRGVAEAVFVSTFSWPVTFFQYKFALLSIGFDASMTIILLSIVATFFAALVPIPAAFGIQEAGHFSVFRLVAVPNVGIALSLVIRFKDLLSTFIGLVLLSHEGLGIFEAIKQKNNSNAKNL